MNKNTTYTPSANKLEVKWYHIDAAGKILGQVATEAAKILIGKNKAEYTPNINVGDAVVITNAEKIAVTGKKLIDKTYYKHTGFPGGLKSETLGEIMEKKPTEALKRAIYGMLPKNKLRSLRVKNLHLYVGPEHPHAAQIK